MFLLLDFDDLILTTVFSRVAKLEHCDDLKEQFALFLYQFINKEFRRGFVHELLAIYNVAKKSDAEWLRENEKKLKKKAKRIKKILTIRWEDLLQ